MPTGARRLLSAQQKTSGAAANILRKDRRGFANLKEKVRGFASRFSNMRRGVSTLLCLRPFPSFFDLSLVAMALPDFFEKRP